jgi:hypothetical protein
MACSCFAFVKEHYARRTKVNQWNFLKSDGSLWGMGENNHGEFGDGTTNNKRCVPRISIVYLTMAVKPHGERSLSTQVALSRGNSPRQVLPVMPGAA